MITTPLRRLRMAICAAIVLGITGTAAPAVADTSATPQPAARQFFVSCSSGSPDGDGTQAAPWHSLSDVNAHGAFQPGEQILLKRGSTCSGRLAPTGSGAAGAPIVIGAYGSGKLPVINGKGTPSGTGTISLVNVQYWTVQDLRITNSTSWSTKGYRSGVLFFNTGVGRLRGLTAQRLQIADVISNPTEGAQGPRAFGGISALTLGRSKDGFDDLLIAKNTLTHIGRSGIVVLNNEYPKGYDRNVRITTNKITRARGDSILLLGSRGSRIDNNVSANGADFWPCPQCKKISPATANAGIWAIRSNTVRIDHNEVYGEHAKGGDGEGFDIDSSAVNIVLEYNYAHDNQGGGVLLCGSTNATVRFNILENNLKSAIAFIGTYPAKNSTIHNNTIYAARSTKASVVRTFNGHRGSGIKFYNNIVYSYYSGTYSWPTSVWSRNNTYIGVHGSGEPHGSGWSTRSPKLKNPGSGKNGMSTLSGYRAKHPSTVGTGIGISKSVTTDFFGKKINPKKPPRGAAG